LAAALALGAEGVQVGTRFMCAEECTIHDSVKERIVKARDRDTVVSGRSTGHPVRVLKNRLSRVVQELDREDKPEEIEELGTGKLRLAMCDGDCDMGSLMAGQSSAMVTSVEPASAIVDDLVTGAEAAMASMCDRSGG
jgi:enoyl-[acyl-carrier protein] reductase II